MDKTKKLKTSRIGIRLTDEQKRILTDAAKRKGLSLSSYILSSSLFFATKS